MEAEQETGHHASSANTFLKPTLSASGSWLSAFSAPQSQHFFLTSDEARRKLDAYFDHERMRTARTAPPFNCYIASGYSTVHETHLMPSANQAEEDKDAAFAVARRQAEEHR
jgi:hypothetical protein